MTGSAQVEDSTQVEGSTSPRFAVFVSPHGFGHAARASAVMRVLRDEAAARFDVFTTVPRWFFDESVAGAFDYHAVHTDVGLHQRSALVHDAAATAAELDRFLPFDEGLVNDLAERVTRVGCLAVLADIAPLGVAVARRAGLASVVLESFTWPWLYEPLFASSPRLAAHAAYLEGWRQEATLRIRTEPYCHDDALVNHTVPPVCRTPARDRTDSRRALGVDLAARLVLVTMGGVREPLDFLGHLKDVHDVTFLVTGADRTAREENLLLFDQDVHLYMPDLVTAADAVVAKLGYSTLAEVWSVGRPLAFVSRPDFRETGPLAAWARKRLPGFELEAAEFASGAWSARARDLSELPAPSAGGAGGAAAAARHLLDAARELGK